MMRSRRRPQAFRAARVNLFASARCCEGKDGLRCIEVGCATFNAYQARRLSAWLLKAASWAMGNAKRPAAGKGGK